MGSTIHPSCTAGNTLAGEGCLVEASAEGSAVSALFLPASVLSSTLDMYSQFLDLQAGVTEIACSLCYM